MSARRWDSLHPATRASIEAQGVDVDSIRWSCGCENYRGIRGNDRATGRLCQYHEGFEDGAEAATREEPT